MICWAPTLVFSVDRIRLTMDILSSFTPVLRISGRSSEEHKMKISPTHCRKVHCATCDSHLTATFDFQDLPNGTIISWHQKGQHKLDKSHADIRSSLKNLQKKTRSVKSRSPKNLKIQMPHTFLSFLFASPDKDLLMWMQLRTSLAASGPWDTKADRKFKDCRTNLCTKTEH